MTGDFPEDYKFVMEKRLSAEFLGFFPFAAFGFGAEPIFHFVAGLFSALDVEFVGTALDESIPGFVRQRAAHPGPRWFMMRKSERPGGFLKVSRLWARLRG